MLKAIRRWMLPHWTDHWPAIVARSKKGKVLHLGAGPMSLPDAISVDINLGTKPDVVWDLNRVPWPFANDTFVEIVALSILEHLDDFLGAMTEIHRVSKSGAVTNILVPHFSSAAAF